MTPPATPNVATVESIPIAVQSLPTHLDLSLFIILGPTHKHMTAFAFYLECFYYPPEVASHRPWISHVSKAETFSVFITHLFMCMPIHFYYNMAHCLVAGRTFHMSHFSMIAAINCSKLATVPVVPGERPPGRAGAGEQGKQQPQQELPLPLPQQLVEAMARNNQPVQWADWKTLRTITRKESRSQGIGLVRINHDQWASLWEGIDCDDSQRGVHGNSPV